MQNKITKFAVVAVVIVAGFLATTLKQPNKVIEQPKISELKVIELAGHQNYKLNDGSTIKLKENAEIKTYSNNKIRGFELMTGEVEVSVVKDDKPFLVKTSLGEVKALGTVFTLDLITSGDVPELLIVDVGEGAVQVTNSHGSTNIEVNRSVVVGQDAPPYDFMQDEKLPARLKERIDSMLTAIETGDKKLYVSNYNIEAMYELVKGKIKYEDHPDWFSGMDAEDANRIKKAFADVESPEQLARIMLTGISDKTHKLYVRGVTLSSNNKHAVADCVERRDNRMLRLTPQWTHFRDDWWQTDD